MLSISQDKVTVMDIESYETFDLPFPTDIGEEIHDGDQVEYWDIEGKKTIKRKI